LLYHRIVIVLEVYSTMKEYIVYFTYGNNEKRSLVIRHNHLSNATGFILKNQWIQDSVTGEYFNFDKVLSFSVEEAPNDKTREMY